MQEFFTLTCQSIKLNSPHMNTICTIDTMQLYKRAQKLNIPFFKWQGWIEDFLNKEFLRQALKRSRRNGISSKPTTKTFMKAEQVTKQKILDQAKFFQQELEIHNKDKGIVNTKASEKDHAGGHRRTASDVDSLATPMSASKKQRIKNSLKSLSMFK